MEEFLNASAKKRFKYLKIKIIKVRMENILTLKNFWITTKMLMLLCLQTKKNTLLMYIDILIIKI